MCEGGISHVPLRVQGVELTVDLFIMPIHRADVVLGVQWLMSLGPISMNYTALSMEFSCNGQMVRLQGDVSSVPQQVALHCIRCLAETNGVASFFHLDLSLLELDSTSVSVSNVDDILSVLVPIIDKYAKVFEKPTGLPLVRDQDHRIPLLPGAQPINVKPYRYPYYQKTEIERLVKEMLQDGVIQPSCSPFSSLVLLVKKKDGT